MDRMDGIDWDYWDKQLAGLPFNLTLAAFSKAVGVSPKVLREDWIYTGRITATNVGKKSRPSWRIHRDQVAVFMVQFVADGKQQLADMDMFELWVAQNKTWWDKTVKEWTEWAEQTE